MRHRGSTLWSAALGIVAVQCALTYGLSREEFLPSPPPLEAFPRVLAEWDRSYDLAIEPGVIEMLGPDDILNRNYADPESGSVLNLFVAYYKTQHRVRNAHDPKVCLPGSGWEPQESKVIHVATMSSVTGEATFPANYYLIRKGRDLAVVLYWFQTPRASRTRWEGLRVQRVFDTILAHRSDMALVRIVTPVVEGDVTNASRRVTQFAQASYGYVIQYVVPAS